MKGIVLKITLVLLLSSVEICQAGEFFAYQVSDTVKTANLHYSIFVNLSIGKTKKDKPAISYGYWAHMEGVNLPSYQYIAMEERTLPLSKNEFQEILQQFSELNTDKLNEGAPLTRELSDGYIEIRGKRHKVSSRPDTAARQLWTRAIVAIRDKYVPKEKRKSYIRTIEGDKVSPKPTTIEQLLQSPEKHDGKRVRVIGYRVNDTLYPDAEAYGKVKPPDDNIRIINDDGESGIILSGPSTIADPKQLGAFNGQQVVIEGTFEFRPHPPFTNFVHKGTFRRLTLIKAFKKP